MAQLVYDVRCSCGRAAVLRLTPPGFMKCDDPLWLYHTADWTETHSRLWHCGRPRHYQADLVEKATEGATNP